VGALPTPSASLRQPRVGWRRLPAEALATVGQLYACGLRLAGHLTIKPGEIINGNHSSIRAEMAASETAKDHPAEIKNCQQKRPTGPSDAAEHKAPTSPVSGRSKPGRTSTPRAYVIGGKHEK